MDRNNNKSKRHINHQDLLYQNFAQPFTNTIWGKILVPLDLFLNCDSQNTVMFNGLS